MDRWNRPNLLPDVHQASFGVDLFSMEPILRIRLDNIRKCQTKSYCNEIITLSTVRGTTQKIRFNWLKNKTREKPLHTDPDKLVQGIDKVNWCDKNNILRPNQIPDGRRHHFQHSRERTSGNDPRTNFLLNRIASPWNNLPKAIALARSVNSFKSKLDLNLGNLSRNTHIY